MLFLKKLNQFHGIKNYYDKTLALFVLSVIRKAPSGTCGFSSTNVIFVRIKYVLIFGPVAPSEYSYKKPKIFLSNVPKFREWNFYSVLFRYPLHRITGMMITLTILRMVQDLSVCNTWRYFFTPKILHFLKLLI